MARRLGYQVKPVNTALDIQPGNAISVALRLLNGGWQVVEAAFADVRLEYDRHGGLMGWIHCSPSTAARIAAIRLGPVLPNSVFSKARAPPALETALEATLETALETALCGDRVAIGW